MLDTNILDPGIGKYFILSQLAIQYLLFCKKFLDETVTTLRESLCESQLENANLKKLNHENNNELLQLHKKFQQMETINEVVFPCSLCTKNFISNDMLNTHMKRKHGKNDEPDSCSRDKDRNLINAIKLELEIKQLKERLNVAEKSIHEKSVSNTVIEGNSIGVQIENRHEMKNVGIQSNLEEPKEKDEEEVRKSEILSELHCKLSEFEHWKEEEKLNNKKCIDDLQQKLQSVVETIDERTRKDEEVLRNIVSNALASVPVARSVGSSDKSSSPRIEDFQKILTETVSKMNEKNSEQLNDVVKKIQQSYEDKLSALEVEIHKQNENMAKTIAAKNQEVTRFSQNDAKSVLQKDVSKTSNGNEVGFVRKDIIQKAEDSRKKEAMKDERKAVDKKVVKENSNILKGFDEETTEDETSISEEESEDDEVSEVSQSSDVQSPEPIIKKPKPQKKPFERSDSIYMATVRYKSLGLPANQRRLTPSKKKEIVEKLEKNQEKLKSIYPNFYATRNKLKKVVEKLWKEKKPSKQPSKKSKPQKEDDFKIRLERILESPIHKPGGLIRPVPVPRKKVMFETPKTSQPSTSKGMYEDDTTSNASSF
ncbi:DZIP1 family protein [Megaselia abdita]